MATNPNVLPELPPELQTQDPTLDSLYGTPPVQPRTSKPPISRALQFADDFNIQEPQVPQELQPTPPPPVPPAPVQQVQQAVQTPEPPALTTPVTGDQQTQPVKVFRVIEVNGRTQRFEGVGPTLADAQNDLLEKLTKAQENASRRIDELREKAKAKPDVNQFKPISFQPRNLTDEEVVQLNELYKTNPVEAMRRWFIAESGTKPQDVAQAVYEAQIAAERDKAQRAEVEFIANHAEDYDCRPESGTKIYAFLQGCTRAVTTGGFDCPRCKKIHDPAWSVTLNNLEYAFETLSEQGNVFVHKPAEPAPQQLPVPQQVQPLPVPQQVQPVPPQPAPVVQPTPLQQPPVQAVPAAPQVPTPPPPPVMLSDRSGQRPAPQEPDGGVNVTDLRNMSLQEMRSRIGTILKRNSPGR